MVKNIVLSLKSKEKRVNHVWPGKLLHKYSRDTFDSKRFEKSFSLEQNKKIIEADKIVGYVCIYTKDLQWLPENSGTVRRLWESRFNFKKFNKHETQELCSVKQTHFTKKVIL